MLILHDRATLDSIRSRVRRLTPDAKRLWGKMTVDQMLWHVNQAMEQPLDEHRRCLALIDEFTSRPIDGPWPVSDTLGRMSGRDWSRLEAKHLDHHLRQFSL